MKRYKTLLFDADMTLFDFDAAEKSAFGIVMRDFGIQYDDAAFSCYKEINKKLWDEYGRGEITKEFLQAERFGRFLATLSPVPDLSGDTVNMAYVDALADSSELFDGAAELCKALSQRFEMYIVTNGVSHTQKKRFFASPIRNFFKDIFVSEDAGAPKPMKAYFDYVFFHIGAEKRADALIIGDSLSSDIAGGITAGIDTVWYNPTGIKNTSDFVPTYEVKSYAELLTLLS